MLALKDGIITAECDGVLASVSYEAGDVLNGDNALVSFSDTSKLTIDVEVDQENIAEVSVGDTVQVQLTGSGKERVEGTGRRNGNIGSIRSNLWKKHVKCDLYRSGDHRQ